MSFTHLTLTHFSIIIRHATQIQAVEELASPAPPDNPDSENSANTLSGASPSGVSSGDTPPAMASPTADASATDVSATDALANDAEGAPASTSTLTTDLDGSSETPAAKSVETPSSAQSLMSWGIVESTTSFVAATIVWSLLG